MSTVGHLVRSNGRSIVTVQEGESVFEALTLMAQHDIGALIVTFGGKVRGLFTERDYARKVILLGRSSYDSTVGELMSPATVVKAECTVEEAMSLMAMPDRRVRYLVVSEGEAPLGIVSIGDLVKARLADQQEIIANLENYIVGPN